MTTENSSLDSAGSGAGSSDSGSSSGSSGVTETSVSQSAGTGSSGGGSDAVSGETAQPVYQPNYKFKAFGKEHEIDESFRAFIKDKDTEERFRKLHEKSYAMEKFQADERKIKSEYDQFKTQAEPNLKAMAHFDTLLKNKDWDNFFGGLKIPHDEIFGWVQKQLEMRACDRNQGHAA
jgi:hypothetical protein